MTDATKTGPNDPPGSGDKTPASIFLADIFPIREHFPGSFLIFG